MSKNTEEALHDALQAHLRDQDVLEEGELLVAWVVAFTGEIPSRPRGARYGHIQPTGQRYHVGHGLAAGLLAGFDNGIGEIAPDSGDEDA
jgi:hypothetical protein